jgi:hypothetical protein
MGNAISHLSEPDEVLFAIWRKRRLEEEEEDQRYFDEISSLIDRCKRHAAEEADASTTRTKRSRRSGNKAVSLMTKDKDGNSVAMNARNSIWWLNYIENPQLDSPRFLKLFRRRFRLPYEQFKELVADAKTCPEYFTSECAHIRYVEWKCDFHIFFVVRRTVA